MVPPLRPPTAPAYLLNCHSSKLAAKEGFTKSDPFFDVTVKPPGYPFPIKLHKSAPQKDTLSPIWEPFVLCVEDIGGLDAEFSINCYSFDKDGAHNLIGTAVTNLREFGLGPVTLALINPAKVGR